MNTTALTRRAFLASSLITGAGAYGAALLPTAPRPRFTTTADAVVVIPLIGGPSQLDTFDPKPDAPDHIRGPFRAIPTHTPGVYFSELFPRLARLSQHCTVVRSLHHDQPVSHAAGLRILGLKLRPTDTGLSVRSATSHMSFAAHLDAVVEHLELGTSQRCFVVPHGSRGSGIPNWDCHGDGRSSSMADLRVFTAPHCDAAVARFIIKLRERGLLDRTLVVMTGEFGRTPRLNCHGGRDHWPWAWSALLAGGGTPGGAVIGATDIHGLTITDNPVSVTELRAMVTTGLKAR